jgi:aryl-alcohol dehydrogenase-like predicted oxidoreductase
MSDSTWRPSRREAIRASLAAGLGLTVSRLPLSAQLERFRSLQRLDLITKPIPSTGEMLPVVGTGTNRYGVSTPEEIDNICNVLRTIAERGGKVIDTARGYGRSEEVIGECLQRMGNRDQYFLATKYSLRAGDTSTDPKAGLELAFSRLRTDMIDLMMVHNLGGTDTLMPHMKEMKEAGRFRYLGISTSSDRQYDDLAAIMRREPLDFIEIDYSLGNRSAEQTMLPLAQERGMAVLINVPFGGRNASMLQEVAGQPLPEWASEIGATSWAQLFLKWIVSHPAVTVVIPGTTRVEHAIDNNSAARGVLPDAAMRRRIEQHYDSIVG